MNKNFAILEAGVIKNIIVIDDADIATISHFGGVLVPDGVCASIGDSYDGLNFSPSQKPLAVVKVERAAFIDSEYERVNQLPISYLGNTFQADNTSTALMTSTLAVLTAAGGAAGVEWWNLANVKVPLTYAQFAGLGIAIFQRGQPYFANKRAKKDLINAATTIAEVEAVIW